MERFGIPQLNFFSQEIFGVGKPHFFLEKIPYDAIFYCLVVWLVVIWHDF